MTFFSGFKPDAKIMGPEPCQNQPDARNTSPIPVRFWHIMACNYLLNLLNFGHHRLVYISSAAADGLLLLYYYHSYYFIIIIIMTTCQGCPGYLAPLETNGAPGNIQGNFTALITMALFSIQ